MHACNSGKQLYSASLLAVLIRMQTLTLRSIEAKSHPETKALLWYLFVGTKGGQTRVRVISQLRNKPSNKNQLAKVLGMDYKGIEHHIKVLEENNLVSKIGSNYGTTFFVSELFENEALVFDEIITKINSQKKFEGY